MAQGAPTADPFLMIRDNNSSMIGLQAMIQAFLLSVLFCVWIVVFKYLFEKALWGVRSDYLTLILIMALALALTALMSRRWKRNVLSKKPSLCLMLALQQTAMIALGVLFYLFVTKDMVISRAFFLTYLPALFVLLAFSNFLLPDILIRLAFSELSTQTCLLLSCHSISSEKASGGTSAMSQETGFHSASLVEWLAKQSEYGMKIIGQLGWDGRTAGASHIPVLGDLEHLGEMLQSTQASYVILLQMPHQPELLDSILHTCEKHAVRVSVYHDLHHHYGRPLISHNVNGRNILHFRDEPLQNPPARILKRAFDIIFSAVVIVFMLPIIALVIFALQAIQAPGPLLYTQVRSGKRNRPFMIVKFRSMYHGTTNPSQQATKGDPRVYPFGRWLRRSSLDELPQFLNVFLGEMSIVGPRPHLPIHNEAWENLLRPYHVRSFIRPGITGLSQMRGLRGEATTNEKILQRIKCDIEYIEHWSFLLDLSLIGLTFLEVIAPKKTTY